MQTRVLSRIFAGQGPEEEEFCITLSVLALEPQTVGEAMVDVTFMRPMRCLHGFQDRVAAESLVNVASQRPGATKPWTYIGARPPIN